MRRILKGAVLCLFAPLGGCGLQYIDAPPLGPEDRWIKNGLSKGQVLNFYKTECHGDVGEWSYRKEIDIDNCMLGGGFIFIDSPYGDTQALCRKGRNIDFISLPSCQSLRVRGNK